MPTYEYVCDACGYEVEFFQSITEGPKRKCPNCGALRLKRRISAGAGIVFKGSGFYETDYRSRSYKEGEKAAKEAAKPGKDASPSKAEGGAPGKDSGGKKAGGKSSGGQSSGGQSSGGQGSGGQGGTSEPKA